MRFVASNMLFKQSDNGRRGFRSRQWACVCLKGATSIEAEGSKAPIDRGVGLLNADARAKRTAQRGYDDTTMGNSMLRQLNASKMAVEACLYAPKRFSVLPFTLINIHSGSPSPATSRDTSTGPISEQHCSLPSFRLIGYSAGP